MDNVTLLITLSDNSKRIFEFGKIDTINCKTSFRIPCPSGIGAECFDVKKVEKQTSNNYLVHCVPDKDTPLKHIKSVLAYYRKKGVCHSV